MANSKAKTKKGSLIYPAVLILPALVLVALSIFLKTDSILPYLLAYALIAALLGFFFASKAYGTAAIMTSIVFMLGIGSYVVGDNLLQKSTLIGDNALRSAVASAFQKFPALLGQADLDKVKVLFIEAAYNSNYDQADGFALTIGYDEAADYLNAEDKSGYDQEEVSGYFKNASSSANIEDFSDLAKFGNLEYIAINQPNSVLYQYFGAIPQKLENFADLGIFKNMSSLKHISLFNTSATDFSPLIGLSSLEILDVQYCLIGDAAVLGGLANLKTLNLTYAGISDISFVSSLNGLEKLYLQGNDIADIGAIKALPNLADLVLSSNKIEDISALRGKSSIKKLYLSNNKIKSIADLSSLGALESVYLSGNEIEDLSPLSGLANLTELDADGNQISDLSPLKSLSALTALSLKNNQISDISPIGSLSGLTSLSLDENKITDFSPIAALEESGAATISGKDNQIVEIPEEAPEETEGAE